MPRGLLDRCQPDSVREFRAAARQRAGDARSLMDAQRKTAAIYLWGYAAEMTLKAAYFKALGFGMSQRIERRDLHRAQRLAASLGIVWGRNLHDVRAWAELLVRYRASTPGLAYVDMTFANRVVIHAIRVEAYWRETLRYRKNMAYEHELIQVRGAAEWLLAHALHL